MTTDAEITDYEIQALIDGSLDHGREKAVLDYVASHREARERYHRLVQQKILLKRWWDSKKKH